MGNGAMASSRLLWCGAECKCVALVVAACDGVLSGGPKRCKVCHHSWRGVHAPDVHDLWRDHLPVDVVTHCSVRGLPSSTCDVQHTYALKRTVVLCVGHVCVFGRGVTACAKQTVPVSGAGS